MINRIERVKSWRESHISEDWKTLSIPHIEGKGELFTLLHELGHAHWKHEFGREVSHVTVRQEVEAWAYAERCVREGLRKELHSFASFCIQTYNSQLALSYGDWYEDGEIREMWREARKELESGC